MACRLPISAAPTQLDENTASMIKEEFQKWEDASRPPKSGVKVCVTVRLPGVGCRVRLPGVGCRVRLPRSLAAVRLPGVGCRSS